MSWAFQPLVPAAAHLLARTAVGDTLELQRDIRALVGDTLELQRDLRVLVGDDLELQRDIRALVGDDLELRRDIRMLVGDQLDLRRDIESSLVAVGRLLELIRRIGIIHANSIQDVTKPGGGRVLIFNGRSQDLIVPSREN